jgi:hypothetical protein
MTRALTAVGVLLVLMIGGLGLAVYFTRDKDYIQVDNLLAERLTRAIGTAEERGEDVDLAREAPFAWDHVLLVARGTEPDAITRRLGYEWNGRIGFQTGELLLFVRAGRVVRFADYRGEARFQGFPGPFASIPRRQAVLRVRGSVVRPAPRRRRAASPTGSASTARATPGPPRWTRAPA